MPERETLLPQKVIVLLCGFAYTVFSAFVGPTQRIAAAEQASDGPLLTFEVAGNRLQVPRNFFLPGPPQEGKAEGLFIIALMPDMAPMREDNKLEFLYPNPKGHGKTVGILIHDASRMKSVADQLTYEKSNAAPYESKPDLYGLKVLVPADTGPDDRRLRLELYIGEDKGQLARFIACDRDGRVPYPGCSEKLTYRNLFVEATYGKGFLADWQKIERSVVALIDRFATPPQ